MMLQVLDADYIMLNGKPVIRIFGKTKSGKTYCVFQNNFSPYFYLKAKNQEKTIEKIKKNYNGDVKSVKKVKKFLPFGYQEEKKDILKIILNNPKKTPRIREELSEEGELYEADILFKYRFFVDRNIKGMNWIDVKGKTVNTDTVGCSGIEAEEIEPKNNLEENIPLKILSLDIETQTPTNRIPTPEKDGITMISLSFSEKYKGMKTQVITSKKVPVKSNWVVALEDEEQMLQKLKEIIDEYDPDIITGFNIQSFDLPFIVGRMSELGIKRDFGRVSDKSVFCRKYGRRSSTYITGRIIFDAYKVVKNDFSFKRYTLDNVSEKLLGKGKIDVEYSDFEKLWNGNKKQVKKLLEYSKKDAELPLEMIEKKNLIDKYVALSRVSGVLIQDVLDGGESVRIENMLLSKFKENDILFPTKPGKEDVRKRIKKRNKYGLKGGLVLEPEKGLHTQGCVVVLDFKSLYPSIIKSYNICPTTLLTTEKTDNFNKTPAGAKFAKREEREGIFPNLLEKLIDQRSEVKKKMYKEEDPDKKRLLDAKQYALKIMANAFYGYTGYTRARAYVMEVANSITAFGRNLIKDTAEKIEKMGYKIIYGDTDSLFLRLETNDLEEARKEGAKIIEKIDFPGQIVLEFEKVFKSFLILTKKRYAGWAFEKNNGKWEDEIDIRGIEIVRRDWPDLTTETMKKVLQIILKEGNIKKAINFVQEIVQKLGKGKVDLGKLAVTKSITKKIENYDGVLPHIELAKRMKKRNPAEPPTPGSRISFVIVRGNRMLSKRAEHPDYIKKNKLKIDSEYYIKNQLLPPLERIFSVIGVDKGELMGMGRQYSLKEVLSDSSSRDYRVSLPPSQTKIKNLRGFVCKSCKKSFRRPPLTGRCICGGPILAEGDGSVGGRVKI